MPTRSAVALAALALAACTPNLIPGTEIDDTDDNRAVTLVIQAYAEALQRKDVPAVLALVAPDYYDTAGTPEVTDDLDRPGLERSLAEDLARIDQVRLEVVVKRIEVRGDQAEADVYYDGVFRVATQGGPVPRRESDLHRMKLKRVAQAWLIASGL